MAIETYAIYNINIGSNGVEKYDAWKVLNLLKDAGLRQVHYKPLTPEEINHFAVSLVGKDSSKIRIVYFTGDRGVAIEAIRAAGLSKNPSALGFGFADSEMQKYVNKKSKSKKVQDSGDWDDGLSHRQYIAVKEIKKRDAHLPRWAKSSAEVAARQEVLAQTIEKRISRQTVK